MKATSHCSKTPSIAATNGLIIAPGNPAALATHLAKAARRGIPVVCVVTDAPDSPRLTAVSPDPFTVGAVAGELLARFLPQGGEVAFFTGWLAMQDHADKLRGFETSLRSIGQSLALGPIVEAHDDEREGYRRALALLRSRPGLKAVYVSTVNSLPVLRAAKEAGRLSNLTFVTTDLFPELVEWIRAGKVAATMYQRPLSQGRLALQALYQYLLNGTRPASKLRVVPHVVMRSNLDQFLERLSVGCRRAAKAPAWRCRRRRAARARWRRGRACRRQAPWRGGLTHGSARVPHHRRRRRTRRADRVTAWPGGGQRDRPRRGASRRGHQPARSTAISSSISAA